MSKRGRPGDRQREKDGIDAEKERKRENEKRR